MLQRKLVVTLNFVLDILQTNTRSCLTFSKRLYCLDTKKKKINKKEAQSLTIVVLITLLYFATLFKYAHGKKNIRTFKKVQLDISYNTTIINFTIPKKCLLSTDAVYTHYRLLKYSLQPNFNEYLHL